MKAFLPSSLKVAGLLAAVFFTPRSLAVLVQAGFEGTSDLTQWGLGESTVVLVQMLDASTHANYAGLNTLFDRCHEREVLEVFFNLRNQPIRVVDERLSDIFQQKRFLSS